MCKTIFLPRHMKEKEKKKSIFKMAYLHFTLTEPF